MDKTIQAASHGTGSHSAAEPRQEDFHTLVKRVQDCRLCPRMEGRLRVLGPANGSINARILFIAEAPGRLGADRSGVPLSGDQSGRNFALLLEAAQLEREAVFITNAVLCNPRDATGNNAPPSRAEMMNCSQHLRAAIEVVQPLMIVTLGQIALQALKYIAEHQLTLATHVGVPQQWDGRWLCALYHPGARARIYRSFALQQEDFRRLGTFMRALEGRT